MPPGTPTRRRSLVLRPLTLDATIHSIVAVSVPASIHPGSSLHYAHAGPIHHPLSNIAAIRLRPRNMAPLLPTSGPSLVMQDDGFLPRSDRGMPIMLRRLTKFRTMVGCSGPAWGVGVCDGRVVGLLSLQRSVVLWLLTPSRPSILGSRRVRATNVVASCYARPVKVMMPSLACATLRVLTLGLTIVMLTRPPLPSPSIATTC